MALSAALIPHVTHFDKADITDLNTIVTRSFETAKQRGIMLTLTSFLLKAAALALQEYPQFNASLDAGAGSSFSSATATWESPWPPIGD